MATLEQSNKSPERSPSITSSESGHVAASCKKLEKGKQKYCILVCK